MPSLSTLALILILIPFPQRRLPRRTRLTALCHDNTYETAAEPAAPSRMPLFSRQFPSPGGEAIDVDIAVGAGLLGDLHLLVHALLRLSPLRGNLRKRRLHHVLAYPSRFAHVYYSTSWGEEGATSRSRTQLFICSTTWHPPARTLRSLSSRSEITLAPSLSRSRINSK